jgi:hypothetical protein
MSAFASMPLAFDMRDARADGCSRQVTLRRDSIVIARRLAGIDMRVNVPLSAYTGVALSVETHCDGSVSYRLMLAHRDADLNAVLFETDDDTNIVALWRAFARDLGLPGLVETAPGQFERADAGRHQPMRRRNAALTGRRPRFLSRRRMGRPSETPVVHADEREIVCYE